MLILLTSDAAEDNGYSAFRTLHFQLLLDARNVRFIFDLEQAIIVCKLMLLIVDDDTVMALALMTDTALTHLPRLLRVHHEVLIMTLIEIKYHFGPVRLANENEGIEANLLEALTEAAHGI